MWEAGVYQRLRRCAAVDFIDTHRKSPLTPKKSGGALDGASPVMMKVLCKSLHRWRD